MRRAVALASVLAFFGIALHVHALPRPAPLEPKTGCDVFRGTASGNDPSVLLEVELCVDANGGVTGRNQWSSTLSGFNVRALRGTVDAARRTYVLMDERILEEHPAPGWMFCTVDRYDLTRDGDHLAGHYASAACRDRGTITLTRDARSTPSTTGPSQGGGEPEALQPPTPGPTPQHTPQPPVPPAPPPTPPPPPARSTGFFGCG